ncbi:uncharacterized protein [Ptychodera flava]|uniref:uncharacterized protein isoform X2 n=1 Tax=Ptychodera flava TaxID=63121 RepID=UPI00396A68B4
MCRIASKLSIELSNDQWFWIRIPKPATVQTDNSAATVSFTISSSDMRWVKGIQIAVMNEDGRGGSHYPQGLIKCLTFNVTGFEAHYAGQITWHFGHFENLITGRYTFLVRALPSGENKRISQQVYTGTRTPGNQPPPQASWQTLINITTDYQTVTGYFLKAPDEFQFTEYFISVSIGHSSKFPGLIKEEFLTRYEGREVAYSGMTLTYHRSAGCNQVVQFTFENIPVNIKKYEIRIQPKPDAMCGDNTCLFSRSRKFTVRENPCSTDKCGEHGRCDTVDQHGGYRCLCDVGFHEINKTCTENPCFTGKCAEHGQCEIVELTDGVDHGTGFRCKCDVGYREINNTCVAHTTDTKHGSEAPSQKTAVNSVTVAVHEIPQGGKEIWKLTIYIAIGTVIALILGLLVLHLYRRRRRSSSMLSLSNEKPAENGDVSVTCTPLSPGRNPNIFILYKDDCRQHTLVVDSFARFLAAKCGCNVNLGLWEENDIAIEGITTWLFRQFTETDKIVVVASKGTRLCWEQGLAKNKTEGSFGFVDRGCFIPALNIISQDFAGSDSERRGKYVTVVFDYSSESDVPEPLRSMGSRFKLLAQFERFYLSLRNVPEMSATSTYVVPDISTMLEHSKEGVALRKAVHNMKNLIADDPDWFLRKRENGVEANGPSLPIPPKVDNRFANCPISDPEDVCSSTPQFVYIPPEGQAEDRTSLASDDSFGNLALMQNMQSRPRMNCANSTANHV